MRRHIRKRLTASGGRWACAAALLCAGLGVWAEDEVVTQGRVYRGTVKSADAAGVVMEMTAPGGNTVITIPRNLILKANVAAPAGVLGGIAAYEKGDFKGAQASLAKARQQFQGLDVGWALTGQLYYARACLGAGELAKAKQAFAEFVTNYPDHALVRDAQAGLAEVELENKNYAAALDALQALAEYFDTQLKPPRSELATAAGITLGVGKCLEGLARPAEALQAYLRVAALYPVEPQAPEALFRAARIYIGLGQTEQAGLRLAALAKEYPASSWAAQAAEERKKIEDRRAAEAGRSRK